MKKLFHILAVAVVSCLSSCSDRPDLELHDYFVAIKSENGAQTSQILSSSNQFAVSYPVNLVSVKRNTDLEVYYDFVVGDGLTEGVDFILPEERKLVFSPGLYVRAIRILYLKREVDASKDNTIVIKLTGTSDKNVKIGYPGPSSRFSSHTITKINDD